MVERVALDPCRGSDNALVAGLDTHEVVVDAVHVVRLANAIVDEVCRRVPQETLGLRGRTRDPPYGPIRCCSPPKRPLPIEAEAAFLLALRRHQLTRSTRRGHPRPHSAFRRRIPLARRRNLNE